MNDVDIIDNEILEDKETDPEEIKIMSAILGKKLDNVTNPQLKPEIKDISKYELIKKNALLVICFTILIWLGLIFTTSNYIYPLFQKIESLNIKFLTSNFSHILYILIIFVLLGINNFIISSSMYK